MSSGVDDAGDWNPTKSNVLQRTRVFLKLAGIGIRKYSVVIKCCDFGGRRRVLFADDLDVDARCGREFAVNIWIYGHRNDRPEMTIHSQEMVFRSESVWIAVITDVLQKYCARGTRHAGSVGQSAGIN